MGDTLPSADEVVGYWFDELSPGQWFRKDIELDAQIGQRFFGLHRAAAAAAGELWTWPQSATPTAVIFSCTPAHRYELSGDIC